jgi:predicted GIY-YIG superfamily endonuclease
MCTNGSCFVAGTPVMSAEGLKPIETLHVGELVAARDELTGNTQWQRIENIFITHDREVWNLSFVDAAGQIEVITATPNHPFALAAGGWRNAAELEPGDQIATLDGRVIQLLMSARDASSATTYNLMVAGDHTYFVGNAGLWVHNQSACCPEAKSEHVYVHRDNNGDVNYIGITDDLKRRAAEHRLDVSKTGETMHPMTDALTHGEARTIEAKLIRERLDEARANGEITGRESIEVQLQKAGLHNKNRGRDPDRWLKIDIQGYLKPSNEKFDIRTPIKK